LVVYYNFAEKFGFTPKQVDELEIKMVEGLLTLKNLIDKKKAEKGDVSSQLR
jgi:hypothetical protein